mgnify:CR=1 FL=1
MEGKEEEEEEEWQEKAKVGKEKEGLEGAAREGLAAGDMKPRPGMKL